MTSNVGILFYDYDNNIIHVGTIYDIKEKHIITLSGNVGIRQCWNYLYTKPLDKQQWYVRAC